MKAVRLPAFTKRDRLLEAISQIYHGHRNSLSPSQVYFLETWTTKIRIGQDLNESEERTLNDLATLKGVEVNG